MQEARQQMVRELEEDGEGIIHYDLIMFTFGHLASIDIDETFPRVIR